MAPTLKHVLTFRAVLSRKDMLVLGSTKGGTSRGCAAIVAGFLKGEDFNAEVVPGGSDWPLIDESAGVAYLDGRGNFRDNQTGDMFYLTVKGLMKLDAATQLALQFSPELKTTKAGDSLWLTTPIFEVSNEKHKWMEQNWFVSQGHWEVLEDGGQAAQHDIYMVVPG